VLRVAWRAQWDSDEGVGTSWLDYPKVSDPDRSRAVRVTRSDRQALPFLAVTRSRPLAIRTEGAFRRLLNAYADTAALSAAVDTLAEEIETAAAVFSADATVVTALEKVLEPLRATLDLEAPAQDVVRFAPEGGTLTGLLRSLAPVLNLGSPDLLLPLERHGSTLSALLSAAELQLLPAAAETVVVIDDFGDQLDSASAEYLAATIRRAAGQAWISTRRPDVGRAFNPGELVRLAGSPSKAYSLNQATSSPHRSAVRQFNLRLLPAMTSRVVVICEGQHDATTLRALSERLMRRDGVEPPAARGVALIEAGGIEAVPKLCQVGAELGFRTVAVLDHDKPGREADDKLTAVEAVADAVVRLPERSAIEAALVAGLRPVILRLVMRRLKAGFGLPRPNPASVDDDELAPFLVKNLKGRGGLHQPFVQLLPSNVDPPRLRALLHEMLRLAAGADETVELSE
jgi:hypothetical protein